MRWRMLARYAAHISAQHWDIKVCGSRYWGSTKLILAGLRQCQLQFARGKPAIEQGRTMPRLFELDGAPDRQLVAEPGPWGSAPDPALAVRQPEWVKTNPLQQPGVWGAEAASRAFAA